MDRHHYWRNRWATRRRFLGASVASATGLSALALTGCGDDDDAGSPTGGATTAGGQTAPTPAAQNIDLNATIRAGVKADAADLDPQSVGGVAGNINITTHFVGP